MPPERLGRDRASTRSRCRDRGVVGFDLAGRRGRASRRRRTARPSTSRRRAASGITVHAGEAAGAESIAEAIHRCHADRIGHGTRLCEDPALQDYVRDRRILVEINITSNCRPTWSSGRREHPVRGYFDAGLAVTLCTDSWLMSGVDAHRRVLARPPDARASPGEEIDRMILNGFAAAFLPWPERERACSEPVAAPSCAAISGECAWRVVDLPAAHRASRSSSGSASPLLPQPPRDPAGRVGRPGDSGARSSLFAIFVLRDRPAGQDLFRRCLGRGRHRAMPQPISYAGSSVRLRRARQAANSSLGVIFAFQMLPTIIFIAALFAILYYLGVMQIVVRGVRRGDERADGGERRRDPERRRRPSSWARPRRRSRSGRSCPR